MPPRKTTVRAEEIPTKSASKGIKKTKPAAKTVELPQSRLAGFEDEGAAPTKATKTAAKQKTHRFSFHAPSARDVFVAGSFNEWNPRATPLKRTDDGSWTVEVPLSRGSHEYRFVVDGEWVNDPSVCKTVGNGLGSSNCVLEI